MAIVSGYVKCECGPVEQAHISLVNYTNNQVILSNSTNSNGYYSIAPVPPGSYLVEISPSTNYIYSAKPPQIVISQYEDGAQVNFPVNATGTITVPPDVTIESCSCSTPSCTGEAIGSSICPFEIQSVDTQSGDSCEMVVARNWVLLLEDSDPNGSYNAVAEGVQIIHEIDNSPPTYTYIPANLYEECGDSTDPSSTGTPVAQDCSSFELIYSDSVSYSGCSQVIDRNWSATDSCGNISVASQRITVVDTTNPTFSSFPPDTSAECGFTNPSETGYPVVSDCTSVTLSHSDSSSNSTGSCSPTITRTWSATDSCGNMAYRTQIITTYDTISPVFTQVPADATLSCNSTNSSPAYTGLLFYYFFKLLYL